nr:hypothetical protein [Candidatus Sigynarchaeum springense]
MLLEQVYLDDAGRPLGLLPGDLADVLVGPVTGDLADVLVGRRPSTGWTSVARRGCWP